MNLPMSFKHFIEDQSVIFGELHCESAVQGSKYRTENIFYLHLRSFIMMMYEVLTNTKSG